MKEEEELKGLVQRHRAGRALAALDASDLSARLEVAWIAERLGEYATARQSGVLRMPGRC